MCCGEVCGQFLLTLLLQYALKWFISLIPQQIDNSSNVTVIHEITLCTFYLFRVTLNIEKGLQSVCTEECELLGPGDVGRI